MPDETSGTPSSLPEHPSLEWLRKQSKQQLAELQRADPSAQLSDAQYALAKQYGFTSWRALKAHIDALNLDGQLFEAAKTGNAAMLATLLDEHPGKLNARNQPYEHTLLHVAAFAGKLDCVEQLLARGLDPNVREKGDNTCPLHWAAAAGHLEVARRLIAAGGDVTGAGDDHELEVIGWASCWDGCDDDAHRAVVELLVRHGARHHIFSAVALSLADEVRRIVATDPAQLNRRMSRNENHQTPLHFAARMRRLAMVALLLELGADPLSVDADGMPVAAYIETGDADRPIMEHIRALTAGELRSAERGSRPPRGVALDLAAAVVLGDWALAERLVKDNPALLRPERGALHLMAKRGAARGVQWLLDHGADPSGRWAHWDSEVTALHLAVMGNHPDVVRLLLERGADPKVRDTKHDSDALGWADFFQRQELVRLLSS